MSSVSKFYPFQAEGDPKLAHSATRFPMCPTEALPKSSLAPLALQFTRERRSRLRGPMLDHRSTDANASDCIGTVYLQTGGEQAY
jgi:hypothetical protein